MNESYTPEPYGPNLNYTEEEDSVQHLRTDQLSPSLSNDELEALQNDIMVPNAVSTVVDGAEWVIDQGVEVIDNVVDAILPPWSW